MNMKRLLSLVAFFATLQASAQQVNPVPDYVFANRMSAGRNTVTDTAAYFSIGPRYGATRGMMPPMVVDTASFSANKRNGLLIFSVQKNKFLYWDSVGVKWAEMAGTAGTALTSADTAALLSTRAWRQKGIDSLAAIRIGGSGTTNYVSKFTGSTTLGNSQIFDNGTNVGIGTASPGVKLDIVGSSGTIARIKGGTGSAQSSAYYVQLAGSTSTLSAFGDRANIFGGTVDQFASIFTGSAIPLTFDVNVAERMRINTSGELLISTTSDAGDYKLQVSGNIYNTGDAFIGGTSGRLGIGRVPTADIDVYKNAAVTTEIVNNNNGSNLAYNADIWTMNITGRRNSSISQANARIKVTYNGDGTTRKGRMAIGVAESSGYGNANVVFTTTPGNRKVSIFGYSTEAYTDTTFSLTSNYVLHGYLMVNGYSIETVPVASFDIDGNASTVMHSSGNWSFGSTTDAGGYRVRVTGDMLVTSSITTGAPTDGTAAPWRLGSYNATAPTATGYVEVLVNGVKYKLLAATY